MKKYVKIGLIAVNALLLILIGLCLWRCGVYSRTLLSQQAASVWRGQSEERFAQVSAFMSVGKGTSTGEVMRFRYSLDGKLADAGIEAQEGQKLWTDAYSSISTLRVKGEKESSQAKAVGVGGDFFLFHPYELMSGSYLAEDDVMEDRVILDQELAWTLFGGSDLEGMSVTINDRPYYVAGVVRRENDKFTEKAFSGEPLIFMPLSALQEIDPEVTVMHYELVISNPISGFALQLLQDDFLGGESGGGMTVENSGRYSFASIWSIFSDFGSRSVIEKGLILPYWENAARISEVYIARLWVVAAVLGIVPFVCLVWLAVRLVIFLSKKLKQGKAAAKDAWDDRYGKMEELREKRREKRERKARGEKAPKRRRGRKTPEPEPEQPSAPLEYDEKAIALDVESIVREIMEEQ